MARRILSIFLLCSLLLLWGCGLQENRSDLVSPVKFYYRVPGDRYGDTEQATAYALFETQGHETDLFWILSAYFDGPYTQELLAPFPKSTQLLSVSQDGTAMQLNLSEELAQLTGIELTMACACITMTCLGFQGVESVSISANGKPMDGQATITMNHGSLLLEDAGQQDMTYACQLYFSDTDNRYLIPEELHIEADVVSLPQYLFTKLQQGPGTAGLAQTIPLETQILNLEVDEGVCNLDLSQAFVDNAPKTELAQRMTILSITNTLTQLEDIHSVVLYLEGARLERYGSLDIHAPLTFDEAAIGPARTSLNERDMNVYAYIGAGTQLSPVPIRIRQSADKLIAEQVLEALLRYETRNGYSTRIPPETSLVELREDQGLCTVVLSQELLTVQEHMAFAIRSVWATVLSAGEYSAVQVLVEGYEPAPEEAPLFAPTVWDEAWLS